LNQMYTLREKFKQEITINNDKLMNDCRGTLSNVETEVVGKVQVCAGSAGSGKTSTLVATVNPKTTYFVTPFKVNLAQVKEKTGIKGATFVVAMLSYDGEKDLIIDEYFAFNPYIAATLIKRAFKQGRTVYLLGDPQQIGHVSPSVVYGMETRQFIGDFDYGSTSYSAIPRVVSICQNLGFDVTTKSDKGEFYMRKMSDLRPKGGDTYYCLTTNLKDIKNRAGLGTWKTITGTQGMRVKEINLVLERQGIELLKKDGCKLLYMALTRATDKVTVYIDEVYHSLLTMPKHVHGKVGGEADLGVDALDRSWYYAATYQEHNRVNDEDSFFVTRRMTMDHTPMQKGRMTRPRRYYAGPNWQWL